jgi:hypothetical protein
MGLDVYLYHYKGMTPFNSFEEAKISYDNICEKVKEAKKVLDKKWEKYDSMSKSEIEALREEGVKITRDTVKGTPWENSIDKWGDIEFSAEEQVEEKNSVTDPDNMFKIGYFRSSYNSGGINSVLRDNGLMDLYGIFAVKDNYFHKPDWSNSLKRIKKLIKDFEPIMSDGLSCMEVDSNTIVESPAKALEIYRKRMKEHKEGKGSFESYSCSEGYFYLGATPIKARGFMSGKNCIGRPCTYVVFESTEGLNWYMNALKIVQETIEWVLNQPDPENYYFHWSS